MRFDNREYEVTYDPNTVSIDTIMETIKGRGFTPSLTPLATTPPEQGRLSDEDRAKLDVRTITHGDAVELSEHLVAGKVTIFDYYADWCGPCLLLARDLEQLLLTRPDVAVRKIDIVTWESEAAVQATRKFKLKGIPYVRVYGPTGEFLGAVPGNSLPKIMALLPKRAAD